MNTYYKKVVVFKKGEIVSFEVISSILSLYNGTWWEGLEDGKVLILRDVKITIMAIENYV